MATEPSESPRRELSAILFADVHGYSRLMAKNEERTYERVTQAIRLIRSLIGDYGGRIQHVAGDGVLALFESPAQALRFAIAIQREFRNEAVWHADDEPIAAPRSPIRPLRKRGTCLKCVAALNAWSPRPCPVS